MSVLEQHQFRLQNYDQLQYTSHQFRTFNFIKTDIINQAKQNCLLESFTSQMKL